MIETTLRRLDGLIPSDRRLIVTHRDQVDATRRIVKDAAAHIIAEPKANNTGCALALASLAVRELTGNPRTLMVSLHADAVIRKEDAFRSTLGDAIAAAATGAIALIGVTPEYPETGYGYIEPGDKKPGISNTHIVKSFKEKPNQTLAREYLEKGYLWNTGMFVWRIETILTELNRYLPNVLSALSPAVSRAKGLPAAGDLQSVYEKIVPVSIDEGVLEKAQNILVTRGDIGWQDVGSWDAIDKLGTKDQRGNVLLSDAILIDCDRSLVKSDGPLVAAIGMSDVVIVHVDGAILVCPKDRAQDVKHVVAILKERGRTDLT